MSTRTGFQSPGQAGQAPGGHLTFRPLCASDTAILRRFLYLAIDQNPADATYPLPLSVVDTDPHLVAYISNFGQVTAGQALSHDTGQQAASDDKGQEASSEDTAHQGAAGQFPSNGSRPQDTGTQDSNQQADCGWLASIDGQPVGAAWTRHIHGYGFIAGRLPELVMAVEAPYRGQGLGQQLLTKLMNSLRGQGVEAFSASVQRTNPARAFYRTQGFREITVRDTDVLLVRDLVDMPAPAQALPDMTFGPWELIPIQQIANRVDQRCRQQTVARQQPNNTPGALGMHSSRSIVLIDGSGGSGKSTFAKALAAHLPDAAVLHTDDIAWWLDPIDWVEPMMEGVIRPWLSGQDVSYRPPGWIARGRQGQVTASGGQDAVLVIEGVGAVRDALLPYAAYSVWVYTPGLLAAERILARDIGTDGGSRAEVAAFQPGWMDREVPFHLEQKPWDRADLIVDGQYENAAADAPPAAAKEMAKATAGAVDRAVVKVVNRAVDRMTFGAR